MLCLVLSGFFSGDIMKFEDSIIIVGGGILLLLLFSSLFGVSESFSLSFLGEDSFPFLFEGDGFGFVFLGVLAFLVVVGMFVFAVKDFGGGF